MKVKEPDIGYYMSLQYPIRVEPIPSQLGGGWVACVPVLGEKVFRGTGDTPEDALRELEDLKDVYFMQMIRKGRQIPPPPEPRPRQCSGQVLVRMLPSMHAELATRADEEGVSINNLIISFVSRGLGELAALREFRQEVALLSLSNVCQLYVSGQAYMPRIADESHPDWSGLLRGAHRSGARSQDTHYSIRSR